MGREPQSSPESVEGRVYRLYRKDGLTIRVDNGPEFISKALDRWAYENGVTLDISRPGKPQCLH